MSAEENPPAFPREDYQADDAPGQRGMSLRDWFAGMAPEPTQDDIATQEGIDRGRNPYNGPHKPALRSRDQIKAFLRYRYADAMLAERAKGGAQ